MTESHPTAGEKANEPTKPAVTTKLFKWKPFNIFSRLLFFDVDPLMAHGYRTRLEPEDLYHDTTVVTENINAEFQPVWEAEMKKPKPDLRIVVLVVYARSFLWTGILYGISQACSLAGPLLLQRITAGIACQPEPGVSCEPKTKLYYYCIGLLLAPAVQTISENHCNFLLYRMGTRMRNALMAAIYRKCVRLSSSSLQAESTGKVVTLMSNDAQKLQDAAYAIHSVWGSPALIIVIIILMWYQIGWATFVSLGVVIALIPATTYLSTKQASFRRDMLQWTDKRVGLMSEVIGGIQMIKFYAWEVPFQKEVMKFRNNEARVLKLQAYWMGIFATVLFTGPVVMAVLCFGSYSIAGSTIAPSRAYTTLAYISLLRFPMSILPFLATMIMNAVVAIQRIQGFLLRGEAKLCQEEQQKGVTPGEVVVKDGEFTWEEEAEKASLTGINIEARPGTLTMIMGSVGSGKSSILSALIGHMSRRSGSIVVGGRIAYVAQTSWIMNDTLRENVTLGSGMEEGRYRLALEASQLSADLKILPNSDLTEIGDRGITLSGGQKQRVSIARALYYDADVYLLDDPLSAVDSHVGRALFEKCIRGPLRDKTVILVTNALQYLPHADNVIWMVNGAIKAQGTYKHLLTLGLNFAELVHMEGEEGHEQEPADVAATVEADTVTVTDKPLHGDADKKVALLDNHINLKQQAPDASARNLTGVEGREGGNISAEVLMAYIRSGGGLWVWIPLVAVFAAEQGVRCYTDRWVGIWFSDTYGLGTTPGWGYLGIYSLLTLVFATFTFFRSVRFRYMCVRASVTLHNLLLEHILRLPKSFFDTNPSGRILNRFSRDTDIMDLTLSMSLSQFTNCIAILIANLVVISIATRWFAIALPPLIAFYIIIQRYYIPAARELQRIESVTRSPIYSKFGEALNGVATIRAYRKEEHFTKVSDLLMEVNASAYVTLKLTASWLAMRLDMLSILIISGTGALCIQGNIDPSLAGLALLYALDLTRYLKQGTNMASQSESNFTSVERIVEYMHPEPEAAPDTAPEVLAKMPKDWPSRGAIEVSNLVMRYRPEMPLVLHGVTFSVQPGEKVGLVGRTGSGKSSILLALFRMVEPESGTVLIDGVDTRTLGVRHLRSQMSIIPQDPFLYKGTVRRNLDPLELHDDTRLWEVLECVGLKPAITALEAKLDHLVVDNGANFSLGQRQLFCLARAMLRNSRILMLDEATASVDVESDANIQASIRVAFDECTMLTIAHRLNTIMDSDQVIVLDNGKVVEAGEPHDLLQQDAGIFTGFVDQTGKSSARYLRTLASSASLQRAKSLLKSGKSFVNRPPDGLPLPSGGSSFMKLKSGSPVVSSRSIKVAFDVYPFAESSSSGSIPRRLSMPRDLHFEQLQEEGEDTEDHVGHEGGEGGHVRAAPGGPEEHVAAASDGEPGGHEGEGAGRADVKDAVAKATDGKTHDHPAEVGG